MSMVICPYCNTKVLPVVSGECPSCRKIIAEPTQEYKQSQIGKIETAEKQPSGVTARSIGGWLIIPAIGVCLNPILGIIGIIKILALLERDPSRLTIFETGAFVIWLFSWYLLFIFFGKKKSTQFYFIGFTSVVTAFHWLHLFWAFEKYGDRVLPSLVPRCIGLIIACMIWIPYFLKSKRVKETFVHE